MEKKAQIFNETEVERALMRLSYERIEKSEDVDKVVLAGIKTRGVPIAERIRENIRRNTGKTLPLSVLDITLDDGFDADVVGVASTCVLCDVCYITLCDDGSQFLVIEFDHRVGVIEGGSEPIIEKNIELCLALARCFHDLYIVDGVVLVKSELLAKIGGSFYPFVSIFLLGILL